MDISGRQRSPLKGNEAYSKMKGDPRQIITTVALIEQKQRSLTALDKWIEDFLQTGQLPRDKNNVDYYYKRYYEKYKNRAASDELLNSAQFFHRFVNSSELAAKLKERFGEMEDYNYNGGRGWKFRSLTECRRIWEARFGGSWSWINELEEWL